DWVYVRYVVTTRRGRKFFPTSLRTGNGTTVRGHRVFRALEALATPKFADPKARIAGIALNGEPFQCSAAELDLKRRPEAYAYTSEKVFYLRSNLVESFPLTAYQMLQSSFENVPDVAEAFLSDRRATVEDVVADLLADEDDPPGVPGEAGSHPVRAHF